MTAITVDQIDHPSLRFTQSDSKVVGMGGTLLEKFKDNAASIVGLMQMAGAAVLLLHESPLIVALGAAGIVTRGVMALYGNKSHRQQMIKSRDFSAPDLGHGVVDTIRKALRPSEYPIEFAAAASLLASAVGTFFGAALETDGVDTTHGKTLIGVGIVSMLAYGYLLFGKEKKSEDKQEKGQSLPFAHSESKAQSWLGDTLQTLKDQPVFTSSLVTAMLTSATVIGNMIEGNEILAITGAIFLASHIIQALFVTKKDFSIEGAREEEMARQQQTQGHYQRSFVEREIQRASVYDERAR